jgi:hypothetical protein
MAKKKKLSELLPTDEVVISLEAKLALVDNKLVEVEKSRESRMPLATAQSIIDDQGGKVNGCAVKIMAWVNTKDSEKVTVVPILDDLNSESEDSEDSEEV